MSRILIAYYSRNGENYVNGEIKELSIGNTEIAINILKDTIKGEVDIFKIEQENEYSYNYKECIEQAKKDLQVKARPNLKQYLKDVSEYDVIYLAYPNYWGTMPMAVFTFLEKYDFTGKVIKPICTHEGSRMGNSEKDIKNICPNAIVEKGLPITGGVVKESRTLIESWI